MTVTASTSPKRIAVLIEQKFEDMEFQVPVTALRTAGEDVVVLGSCLKDEYKGKRGKVMVKPDGTTSESRAQDFDAVIIPGGKAPDKMRLNPNTVLFIKDAMAEDKLIAAVCHGPQLLIEADLLQGKQVTGFRAIRKDLENAGATYIDEPVVIDKNLITSRKPSDLPIFTAAILTHLGHGADLPQPDNPAIEWWHYGQQWNGLNKGEIVEGLGLALRDEQNTLQAFESYAQRISDQHVRSHLNQVCSSKRDHVQMLKKRLNKLVEPDYWDRFGMSTDTEPKQGEQSRDELALMRQALGDLQTAVVDAYSLSSKLTDPASAEILTQIEKDSSQQEQRLAQLYQAKLGTDT
ncbi:type 1 glutamine amidotransferase domain-containing protein [Coleofasciculus sp.]|uniref:type 1 glutamine amidotransferase domain-containing protein n=1 Tax=Coleofasciculus sp. TaxID=3100458 RepID=UPI003A39E82F